MRDEDGFALALALAASVVLSILVAGIVEYTASSNHTATQTSGNVRATQYAEAGLQAAYSTIVKQNNTVGGTPASPTLLGCAALSGGAGASDCSNPTPLCIPLANVCPSSGTAVGTARVFGVFGGLNGTTYNGVAVAKSTWLLISTGYAPGPDGTTLDGKSEMGTVLISPLSAGSVASLWNHIFVTAQPTTPASCQLNFSGNGTIVDVPVYTIGNVCLAGQNTLVKEVSGGQKVDLMIGGVLSLSGSGSSVGDYTTTPATPITSGVVQGGCTTAAIPAANSGYPACNNGSFRYAVTTADAYIQNDAPDKSTSQIQADYSSFAPGPSNACTSGTLAASTFDNTPHGASEPDNTAATFELTPSSSDYSCTATSSTYGTGTLNWNHTTHVLTLSGSIFIDGNVTISNTATYTGTAVLETAGTITFLGNNQTVCAVYNSSTKDCDFTAWQGSSSNLNMLTLAALNLGHASSAILFSGNAESFQGSIWMPSTSQISFAHNGVHIEGPIAVGSFDATFNNAVFEPLPVIENMPVGAPIPPNTSASIGPLIYTRG